MIDDKPQHECGIFGIYAPDEDVARLTFFGLYALQHRGQESAGIAVSNGRRINVHKEMGLVAQVFDEHKLRPLQGYVAIGHTRYSTTGSSKLQNAQPFVVESALGPLAVGQRQPDQRPRSAPGAAAPRRGPDLDQRQRGDHADAGRRRGPQLG
ncbi:MAG: hypothetical protein U0Z44_05490 [Kouleothrix sp.]